MKAVKLVVGLLQVLVFSFSPAMTRHEAYSILVGGQQRAQQAIGEGSTGTVYPDSSGFHIVETGNTEPSSAVAYGDGVYVIAYVKQGYNEINSIYLSVVADEFAQPLPYKISQHTSPCGQPAIAYHADSELFIIVYEHNHKDIYAQVFSASTEFIGPVVLISSDEVQKGSPAVACNQTADSCLVAYQNDGTHIKGRYIDIDSGGIAGLSEVYALTDADGAGRPHLAWGRGSGTYLVAYNERLASGEVRPSYTHVFDHDNPLRTGIQLHPSQPVLSADFYATGKDAFVTDVAFDPCTQRYLLSINYDAFGDGSNFDLWGAVVDAINPITSGAFPIAETPASEHGGAICFITADHEMPACGSMDRLVVTYINAEMGLMAAELRGNSNPTAPSYAGDPADQHLLVAHHSNMFLITSVRLKSDSMRMLVAYERNFPFSESYDVFGSFLAVRSQIYLPLVMR